MGTESKQGFSLAGLLVVMGVVFLFIAVIIPACCNAVANAGLNVVSARGKDIYVSIVSANVERELAGVGSVWSKTQIDEVQCGDDGKPFDDIVNMAFSNAVDYFKVLYDEENAKDPDKWAPYYGFDYSKLAGRGVRTAPSGRLKADYCMWCIAGNVRDEMEAIIPVLVTRNVDCSSLYKDYDGTTETPLRWSEKYDTPYREKGFTIVRKGGAVFTAGAQYTISPVVYQKQSFTTTAEGKAPLVYLTPDGIAYPQ
ncbi:MAG: hypothetical protein FWG50_07315 [Kiritimatiellaeota bacterium]|nr:hypothetical protein [Kiritimatiellota bacterium]